MFDRELRSHHSETSLVSLPESFFTQVMPKIQDLAELKVVSYVAYLILRKQDPSSRKPESSVTYRQLKTEACRLSPELDEGTLRRALDSAVKHGTLSHSTSNTNEVLEDVYSLTVESRQSATVNIFTLYEQNIGIITHMMAENLKDAEKLYPPRWIEEAFEIAVKLNKRNWGYIARILERWASEGKDSGEYKRNIKKDDPDKYIKGKYGRFVKR